MEIKIEILESEESSIDILEATPSPVSLSDNTMVNNTRWRYNKILLMRDDYHCLSFY